MTEATADDARTITGLSRRKLLVEKLRNPTGKFHVGLVHAYDVFPDVCKNRVKKDRYVTL
jgi:hypothetical protein